LQQFYIYAIDFPAHGYKVGMRAKELMTLDNLPEDILAQIGDKVEILKEME
jgi:nitrogen fixation protein NifZ